MSQTPAPAKPRWPVRERSKSNHLRHSLRQPWRLSTGEDYPVTVTHQAQDEPEPVTLLDLLRLQWDTQGKMRAISAQLDEANDRIGGAA